jgi:ribosomal RNA-processing protein 1
LEQRTDPPPLLDRKLRTQALTSLRSFLSARHISSSLTRLEILKLWKGLFYAMWMCDRPLPQQQLAQDLADLMYAIPSDKRPDAVVNWLRGFWGTMAREWTGIDVLRMDKFLLLVRRVLGGMLGWMREREAGGAEKEEAKGTKRKAGGKESKKEKKSRKWNKERVDAVVGILGDYPFVLEADARTNNKEDDSDDDEEEEGDKAQKEEKKDLTPAYVPVGLKIHALDIWVDECEKVGLIPGEDDEEKEMDEEAKGIVHRITQLVDELEKGTTSPAVRIRAKQSLMDDRLPWNHIAGSEDEDMEE